MAQIEVIRVLVAKQPHNLQQQLEQSQDQHPSVVFLDLETFAVLN